MAVWHHADPARARREIEAVQAQFPGLTLVGTPDLIHGWTGTVTFPEGNRAIEVRYPDDYPARAPSVWDHELTALQTEFWQTGHQYPDRSLCLYADGLGEGAWHAEWTTADALQQYVRLISAWDAGELTDDYGAQWQARVAQATVGRVFVPATVAERMKLRGAYGRLIIRQDQFSQDAYVEGLTVATHDGLDVDCPDAWIRARGQSQTVEGVWWSTDTPVDPARWPSLEATRPEALAWSTGPVAVQTPSGLMVALAQNGQRRLRPTQTSLAEAAFARVVGVAPRYDKLGEGDIIMVGLGSLGSRIADLLARSGARQFHLFDPQRLEPENLSRHLGSVDDLYQPKVTAVARHLHWRRPDVRVHTHAAEPLFQFNWAPSEAAQALRSALRHPKAVLVVTTADEASEQAANRLALEASCPVVFASAIGAAEHGRVFRVWPGRTPCYRCVVAAQAEGERYGFHTEHDETYRDGSLPGLAIHLDHVAAIAARLALATLAERCDVDVGLGEVADHTVWTNRGGGPFDRPLQALDEVYERRPDCPACAPRVAAPMDPELAALITAAQQHQPDGEP